MTSRSYWRDLLQLLRTVADNPVAVHSRPWRARGFQRLFWWLQVAFVPLCVAIALWVHLVLGSRPGEVILGMNVPFVAGGAAVMFALNLLAYASPWSDRERLEELWLTPLSAREVAFGTVFWPLVAGSLVPAGAWLATAACVGLNPGEWLLDYNGFTPWVLVALFVEAFAVSFGACIALGWWFLFQRLRWMTLVATPLLAFVLVLWCAFCIVMVLVGVDQVAPAFNGEKVFAAVACAVAPVAFLLAMRAAGGLAVVRFWSPLFSEPLERRAPVRHALAVRRDPVRRARSRQLLREWVPVRHAGWLAAWAMAAVVLLALESQAPRPGDYSLARRAWNPWLLTLHLQIVLLALAGMELVREGTGGFRIVPGRLIASLARRYGWPVAIYAALMTAGSFQSFILERLHGSVHDGIVPLASAAAGSLLVGAGFAGAIAWSMTCRRPHWPLLGIALGCAGVLAVYLQSNFEPNQVFWHHAVESELRVSSFGLGIWITMTIAALSIPRLHARGLAHLDAHEAAQVPEPAPPPAES